eukprot:Platyproteum_vivax@DN5068_c0_g1_i2.p1
MHKPLKLNLNSLQVISYTPALDTPRPPDVTSNYFSHEVVSEIHKCFAQIEFDCQGSFEVDDVKKLLEKVNQYTDLIAPSEAQVMLSEATKDKHGFSFKWFLTNLQHKQELRERAGE